MRRKLMHLLFIRTISIWNYEKKIRINQLFNHQDIVNTIIFIQNGKTFHLISGGNDRKVRIWCPKATRASCLINIYSPVQQLVHLNEENILVTMDSNNILHFYNLKKGLYYPEKLSSEYIQLVPQSSISKNCLGLNKLCLIKDFGLSIHELSQCLRNYNCEKQVLSFLEKNHIYGQITNIKSILSYRESRVYFSIKDSNNFFSIFMFNIF